MFKKVKPAVLMIVLIILLAVYFIVRYSGQGDRNFKDKVMDFDPRMVTEVLVTIPGQPEQTHLVKEGNDWKVMIKGQSYLADSNAVYNMLGQFSQMETKRYAGKSKEVWKKYELTDSAAVTVEILRGKKEIASLMVGKFDYTQPPPGQVNPNFRQQQQGEMTTYVRLKDEKDVYAVDGFLKMTVGRDSDAFRDKNLTMVNRQDITRITYNYPEGNVLLERQDDGHWFYNGMPTDSIQMVRYINPLSRLTSQDFIYDDLDLGVPSHSFTIEGNNFSPIEIKAYPVADTNIQYAVISSRNPQAVFNGKKSKLLDKLIADESSVLSGMPEK